MQNIKSIIMQTNNIQPENNQSKENWSKPEVNLLSVNTHTLGSTAAGGPDSTAAANASHPNS
jgi:hypothetical protein